MSSAIEVRGFTKSYGDHQAVRGIDLDVEEGEIVAVLGPNGAGKTTTIEVLEGFRIATSGSVRVLGQDPARAPQSWREDIGIVLQESEPVPELTALESIQMHASYYLTPLEPNRVLDLVGLTDSADQRTMKLSGGQKRRLDLALALVGDPKLVFLDEPTTGFDPSARREAWGMIDALRETGNTVLLTTHYMDEAEQLADRIVVIADGLIVAEGTAAELAKSVGAQLQISWKTSGDSWSNPSPLDVSVDETGRASAASTNPTRDLYNLTSWAIEEGILLDELEVVRPTLEDVYLTLTGKASS